LVEKFKFITGPANLYKDVLQVFFWLKLQSKSITIRIRSLSFGLAMESITDGKRAKIYESVDS
ncbi:MAG: hypothetical protein MUP27_13195, partial [Desulfobacterales bacterium]|nr:hypothetical protein [Desulfobacterales bacterium]